VEAFPKVTHTPGAYPPIIVLRTVDGAPAQHRIARRQNRWIVGDCRGMDWREARVHELRPAELTVLVFGCLAHGSIGLLDQSGTIEVLLLTPEPPVLGPTHPAIIVGHAAV